VATQPMTIRTEANLPYVDSWYPTWFSYHLYQFDRNSPIGLIIFPSIKWSKRSSHFNWLALRSKVVKI